MATNESGIDSDLIRGHIDTIILKALFEGDKYGYEICKEVEEKSGGTYELKQPTLYSCLKRLESQKLISSYWTDSEIGGKRHYYKLTDLGKETYQKNQDDWNRSRVIIDNLISNGEGEQPKFIISETSKKEIDELQKQVEDLKKQLEEEKQNKPEPEEKIVYVPSEPETKIVYVPVEKESQETETLVKDVETDQTADFIPWGEPEKQANDDQETPSFEEIIDEQKLIDEQNVEVEQENLEEDQSPAVFEDEPQTENIVEPDVEKDGEQTVKYVQLSDNFIAKVASNGEILSVEKAPQKSDEEQEEIEDQSPAQASVFEDNSQNLVFEDEQTQEEVHEETQNEEFDIMALLGHTQKEQVEYSEKQLLNSTTDDQLLISRKEKPKLENAENKKEIKQNTSPFVFKIDDDFDSSESFFDSQDKEIDEFYDAPVEKIDGKEIVEDHGLEIEKEEIQSENENSSFEIFGTDETVEDEKNNDETSKQTPVYHSFISDNRNYEEADLTKINLDDIYEDPDKEQKNEESFSLFDEDDLIENNEFENEEPSEEQDLQPVFEDEFSSSNDQNVEPEKTMPFYESTESYDSMQTNYTDEKYKEKLSSLMSYQAGNGARENYKILVSPKEFKDLKSEFEEEGIIVKPHVKMVKESKSTRSYVQSNKLNIVNSWTSFGIVSFIATLVFLIMNNYKTNVSSFGFSAKYFLIGLGILMVVPLTYSVIYFINPYKKKPARYAYRVYILFALLLTIQFLIIIYSINLQLGFYSIHQENYNHLYWIVPTILSIYPLVDAIMHGIYFNGRNFHV